MRGLGIQPNMLVIRTENQLVKGKTSCQFCDVAPEAVIESLDVEHLCQNPIELAITKYGPNRFDHLKLNVPAADMTE